MHTYSLCLKKMYDFSYITFKPAQVFKPACNYKIKISNDKDERLKIN